VTDSREGSGYPLVLDLRDRPVLVAGGGAVARRRVAGLLEAGADVLVVAPRLDPELGALADAGRVRAALRPVAEADLDGVWLAHACTDDPDVNTAVATAAAARRVPCVRADAAGRDAGSARTPAVHRGSGLLVAVASTGGADPRRVTAVRDAVALLLDTGRLPLRAARTGEGGARGWVALVGGGPGDPGLVTVRGRTLLAQADVVVTDRLAPQALLETLTPDVEVVHAGKRPHGESMAQEEINRVLVDRALAGARVVRLKGGDPFVFGRGGEEAEACVRAGVPFEVVPGVTSAIAVPAYAGIPVTHRGLTQDFAVVSGHLDPSQPGSTVDWAALASGPGTLVLLMAVGALPRIATELVKHGRDAATPAAVVHAGTTPRQRVVVADLATIAERAAGVPAPSVVVVGDVVRMRETLAWFSEAGA
jgi:uroporphyrin-III C-methyltransferase/precorrin-2 dehydrogenase/sirohydrochlorin ferrochelatase